MIGAYVGGVAFLAIPMLCAWMLIDGFRKGGMLAKGHRYYRHSEPVWFWILAGTYGTIATVYVSLFSYMALNDYLRS